MCRRFATIAFISCLIVATVGPAHAQDEPAGEAIKGVLESIDNELREPVAGVTMIAVLDGSVIGTAESAEDGSWLIAVPGPGVYTVELDVGSLPDGVALTDPDRVVLDNVAVRAGQEKTVRFQLGPGISAGAGDFDRFADLVVIGLKFGAIIALASIGLSLVYGVTQLVNFAHGELITMGAVLAFFFNVSPIGPQWPLVLAAIPALVIAAGVGWAQETGVWRPLRRRGTGLIAMLVISIGLSLFLRHVILWLFDGLPRSYADYVIQDEWRIGPIDIVPKNVFIILAALVILGGVGLFLQKTRTGTAMRAVSDNVDLAESSGINVEQIVLITWVVGTTLAALGGIFFGVTEGVQWDMGFRLLLFVFAAVVLGGLGTAYGAMLGAFIIGLTTEVSTFWVDVQYKNVIAYGLLIAMLLLRPQGLLGQRERIG